MEIQHLNINEVKQCADSIAMGSAAESVSDISKKHLKECEQCQNLVNKEAEFLKIKYSKEIANCLNNTKSTTGNKNIWIVIMLAIIVVGIIAFTFLTDNI